MTHYCNAHFSKLNSWTVKEGQRVRAELEGSHNINYGKLQEVMSYLFGLNTALKAEADCVLELKMHYFCWVACQKWSCWLCVLSLGVSRIMDTVCINTERDAAESHTGPTEYCLSLGPITRRSIKKPMKKSWVPGSPPYTPSSSSCSDL